MPCCWKRRKTFSSRKTKRRCLFETLKITRATRREPHGFLASCQQNWPELLQALARALWLVFILHFDCGRFGIPTGVLLTRKKYLRVQSSGRQRDGKLFPAWRCLVSYSTEFIGCVASVRGRRSLALVLYSVRRSFAHCPPASSVSIRSARRGGGDGRTAKGRGERREKKGREEEREEKERAGRGGEKEREKGEGEGRVADRAKEREAGGEERES